MRSEESQAPCLIAQQVLILVFSLVSFDSKVESAVFHVEHLFEFGFQ